MLEHLRSYLANLPTTTSAWSVKVRSPGRINIIGEHLDYNGGLVMPASIDLGIDFAVRPTAGSALVLHAVDLGERHVLELPVTGKSGILWVDYLAGVAMQFQERGHTLYGLEIAFGGNLPRGSGMSSSAALEGGMAFLLNELLDARLSRPELAQLCQRSSNTFVGIPSGIMDQYASLNGLATGPIVLDCNTLVSRPVRDAIKDHSFVLVNSMVSHDMSDGAYAARVAECQAALRKMQSMFPDLPQLAGATQQQFERVADRMTEVERKRAGYVIAENSRVTSAMESIESGDAPKLGNLLNASHRGLAQYYQVSCAALDYLQTAANDHDAVAGARMMGGGFGGCTLNLVQTAALDRFSEYISASYESAYQIRPEVYPVNLSAGTYLL